MDWTLFNYNKIYRGLMRFRLSLTKRSRKRLDQMAKKRRHSITLRMMRIAIRISSLGRINTIEITLRRRIWSERIGRMIHRSRREMLPRKSQLKSSFQSMTLALKGSRWMWKRKGDLLLPFCSISLLNHIIIIKQSYLFEHFFISFPLDSTTHIIKEH